MLKSYKKDGFYVSRSPILSGDIITTALTGVDNLMSGVYDTGLQPPKSRWNPDDDKTVLRKINMPQISSMAIRDLLMRPELGLFAHRITGAKNIQVWWTQLIYKSPSQSEMETNEITCHQDSTYETDWDSDSHLFTIWISLSDIPEDSGPIKYLRGSHILGGLKRDISYLERYQADGKSYNPYLDKRFKEVSAHLNKGQITCHHRHIFHGSGPNKGSTPRIGIALHLCADNSKIINRSMYTEYLDHKEYCPILYGEPNKAKR